MSDLVFPSFEEVGIDKRRRRLPHWQVAGATYFVTFRLNDSLPESVVNEFREERRQIQRELARESGFNAELWKRARQLFSEKIDKVLDSGVGACHLKDPRAAQCVRNALLFFHGNRYKLRVWCVMPNHVHALFTPLKNHSLDNVLHSWKSYTAHEINKLLSLEGTLWQGESYDHVVRCTDEYEALKSYILENPAKAKLRDWPYVGCE